MLLPEGYPASVSADYLEYQVWDTLQVTTYTSSSSSSSQAFASSITGSLATAAVLQEVGVGDAAATPLAATLTWLVKDGAGMLGRIVFAAYAGTSLDHDCKRWRLFADATNDLVMLVELAAPLLPAGLLLPTLCLAGVGRSLVGVAGGASKAAVAQHQALRSNMADLAAKDGSQETLVNLVALCLNLALLPLVSGSLAVTLAMFAVLTCLHLYANYRAVTCLVLPTLNSARLGLVARHLAATGEVLGPAEANRREPVLRRAAGLPCRLGVSLVEVAAAELPLLEAAVRGEEEVLVLPGRVLVSDRADARQVYGAAVAATVGEVEGVVGRLEAAGWEVGTLALTMEGFLYNIPR